MNVVTSAKARLLFNAGICNLEQLACCEEDSIAQALASGIRHRKSADLGHERLKIGKTGAQGTNALIARDARQILQGKKLPDGSLIAIEHRETCCRTCLYRVQQTRKNNFVVLKKEPFCNHMARDKHTLESFEVSKWHEI